MSRQFLLSLPDVQGDEYRYIDIGYSLKQPLQFNQYIDIHP